MVRKSEGDKDFGRERTFIGQVNKDAVFNAIRNIGISDPKKTMVRLEDIEKELEEQTQDYNKYILEQLRLVYESGYYTKDEFDQEFEKEKEKTITRRTIQNCIKRDHRIKKDTWYFYIDDEARFEQRYLNPEEFGRTMFRNFAYTSIGKYYIYQDKEGRKKLKQRKHLLLNMKGMVETFGVFLVYSFIEWQNLSRICPWMSRKDKTLCITGSRIVFHWMRCLLFSKVTSTQKPLKLTEQKQTMKRMTNPFRMSLQY